MAGCNSHVDHSNRIEKLEGWQVRHEKENAEARERLFAAIKDISDKWAERLPIWVTIAFTIGGSLITGLVMLVVKK